MEADEAVPLASFQEPRIAELMETDDGDDDDNDDSAKPMSSTIVVSAAGIQILDGTEEAGPSRCPGTPQRIFKMLKIKTQT